MTLQQTKRISRYFFGTGFIIAGANHFVMTPFYVSIVPPYLPWPLALVVISGLAEIGLGALLLLWRWSTPAAWGLIALLIAVFPANLHMALHPELYPWAPVAALWLRLPLQGVLIGWAYWHTRPDEAGLPLVHSAKAYTDPARGRDSSLTEKADRHG